MSRPTENRWRRGADRLRRGSFGVRLVVWDRVLRLRRLHRDERGVLSVMSLIFILGLAMLLGMIINVGRHVDDKLKMQNAADAATYSSTVVLARGMNAVAFSNHLLCDTFALTAFLREARDQNAQSMTPAILQAWSNVGGILEKGMFPLHPRFQAAGPAIAAKVPLEREAVRTFGELGVAVAAEVLPPLEYSLRERLIPEYQRALIQTMPLVAQSVANDVSVRHGRHPDSRQDRSETRLRGLQVGVLWRTSVQPAGYPDERDPSYRTLPAVDPSPGTAMGTQPPVPDPTPDGMEGLDFAAVPGAGFYLQRSLLQREQLARGYLDQWVDDRLRFFAYEGKMSQYFQLYHVFACGQLLRLLNEEYPTSNLLHVIRLAPNGADPNRFRDCTDCLQSARDYLDQGFMFVGVSYRRRLKETQPGLYRWALSHDPLTFAQAELFIPQARMWWHDGSPGGTSNGNIGGGGFGVPIDIPLDPVTTGPTPPGWHHDNWSADWSLLNQNWTVRLVPATHPEVISILQTHPPAGAIASGQPLQVVLPGFSGLDMSRLRDINSH
jgi:hypothetical protein